MGWRIPKGLNSDNVTQSSSIDFADFCKSWDIQHISLQYPQSNGAAERAVGTAEHILHQHVSQLALLSYRALQLLLLEQTLAQVMLGCQIHTTLPVLERNLQTCNFSPQQFAGKDKKAKAAYKYLH